LAGFFTITPIGINVPATGGAWADIDLSGYIPSGANGIVGLFNHSDANAVGYGFRSKGSGDDRRARASGRILAGVIVGCDANRFIECNSNSSVTQTLYVFGYTKAPDVVIGTDGVPLTPSVGSWQTVDLSVQCPGAIGIILEVYNSATGFNTFGARMNGSGDNRTSGTYGHNTHDIVIGCDASQLIQLFRGATSIEFYIRGYITANAVFNQNAVEYVPTVLDTWQEKTIPTGKIEIYKQSGQYGTPRFWLVGYALADICFFEMEDASGWGDTNVGIRKKGDTLVFPNLTYFHPWFNSQILGVGGAPGGGHIARRLLRGAI
jgi:hypothetical protein